MEIGDSESEIARFWDAKGRERGGTVDWRTMAVLLGEAGGPVREIPGLLYRVGDAFWFEDVPRDSWIAKLFPARPKAEPTLLRIEVSQTRMARLVARRDAMRCVYGTSSPAGIRPLEGLRRVFAQPAVQWDLTDGRTLFLETARQKDLLAVLAGSGSRPA